MLTTDGALQSVFAFHSTKHRCSCHEFCGIQDADVVLLGETHDDSIAHQLQLQLMLGALKQVQR